MPSADMDRVSPGGAGDALAKVQTLCPHGADVIAFTFAGYRCFEM